VLATIVTLPPNRRLRSMVVHLRSNRNVVKFPILLQGELMLKTFVIDFKNSSGQSRFDKLSVTKCTDDLYEPKYQPHEKSGCNHCDLDFQF